MCEYPASRPLHPVRSEIGVPHVRKVKAPSRCVRSNRAASEEDSVYQASSRVSRCPSHESAAAFRGEDLTTAEGVHRRPRHDVAGSQWNESTVSQEWMRIP